MNIIFQEDWNALSNIQREAAEWHDGPIVVLAGPGSGKTRVLTCHIAYLFDKFPNQNFRILGLTFTNKAADEMRERVQKYVPEHVRRLFIGTFHSFCADILRQHGIHIGINPNFHIYSQEGDLQSVLNDAVDRLQEQREDISDDLKKALPVIHRLKARLIIPENSSSSFPNRDLGEKFAVVYFAYEQELSKRNALDFNSLILKSYELLQGYPALAERYRKVYTHICIDEFQDTNLAQYQLIRSLTGEIQKNVFIVADDDQIIYQWNGASHKRIQEFIEFYQPKLIQLPVNYRCPPEVVDIANKLINHNFRRTPNKADIEASRIRGGNRVVRLLGGFDDSDAEGIAIAKDIKKFHSTHLDEVVVLARNRRLLELLSNSLNSIKINNIIHQRKGNFESTPLRLLIAVLSLADDRQDRKSLDILCGTYAQITGIQVDPVQIETQASLQNKDLLKQWVILASQNTANVEWGIEFINLIQKQLLFTLDYQQFIRQYLGSIDEIVTANNISGNEMFTQYNEEKDIWHSLFREIRQAVGNTVRLDAFLQEMQMRPKDPVIPPNTVTLMTIHAAKGKEFKHVYLIGLVESELPSYQSIQKGDESVEIEEERRNCFVAITRTEETLTLSYAQNYRGWPKRPSRFLYEMGLLEQNFDEF